MEVRADICRRLWACYLRSMFFSDLESLRIWAYDEIERQDPTPYPEWLLSVAFVKSQDDALEALCHVPGSPIVEPLNHCGLDKEPTQAVKAFVHFLEVASFVCAARPLYEKAIECCAPATDRFRVLVWDEVSYHLPEDEIRQAGVADSHTLYVLSDLVNLLEEIRFVDIDLKAEASEEHTEMMQRLAQNQMQFDCGNPLSESQFSEFMRARNDLMFMNAAVKDLIVAYCSSMCGIFIDSPSPQPSELVRQCGWKF